jgi:hypothetical protein
VLLRESVVQAFAEFDRDRRDKPGTASWEDAQSRGFVVEHDERRYPPKTIVSFASGVAVSQFSWSEAREQLTQLGFRVVPVGQPPAVRPVHVWWVNQGDSFARESAGGYVQAPKTNKTGADRGAYSRLQELRAGDVTVHYAGRALVAIGRVIHDAFEVASEPTAPPPRGKAKKARPAIIEREKDSWRADVEYVALGDRAVAFARLVELYTDFAIKDGPFQNDHKPKNGYLWRFSIDGLRRLRAAVGEPWPAWAPVIEPLIATGDGGPGRGFPLDRAVKMLIESIEARGVWYEPWQVAAYVTALRTKPFVILAGVSGTGKSRLPREIARATGSLHQTIAVRADWTDSADLLGYIDLQGAFRPGKLLLAAEHAEQAPGQFHVCVLDEMNLARVEHYFPEVLSRLESRTLLPDGSFDNEPLVGVALSATDARWANIRLPPNLAIVGTVNMDDSAHPFSRKVLDRAFTLEMSDFDLRSWEHVAGEATSTVWPILAWQASENRLSDWARRPAMAEKIRGLIDLLVEVNEILQQAQLQIAYRTRDEIVQFVLHAGEIKAHFVTRDAHAVDPIDLALMMKILPRIIGGTGPVREVVIELLLFAAAKRAEPPKAESVRPESSTRGTPETLATEIARAWRAAGRPAALADVKFPRTAARLCLMWLRLLGDGYTSFWL